MLPYRKIKPISFEVLRVDRNTANDDFVSIGNIEVFLLPSDTMMNLADDGMSKRFSGIVDPDTDIKQGDKIVNSELGSFIVAGVNDYKLKILNHREIILERVER